MEDYETRRRRLTKESGPTGRTVAVLDFLAMNPESEYTFAELARQTGISKATLHDIVKILVANDYLRRSNQGQLSLGPAIIGLGEAALGGRAALLSLARPLMTELAAAEEVQCIASAVIDDDIVILARYGDRLVRSPWYEVGESIPFAPPIGTVFLAWSDERALQQWLGKSGDSRFPLEHQEVTSAVGAARSRGYTFGLRVNARERLQSVLAGLESEENLDRARARVTSLLSAMENERYLVAELSDTESYDVDFISSPVFDASGQVTVAINVVGFTRSMSRSEVELIGRQLTNTAVKLTHLTGGRTPSSFPLVRGESR